MKTCRLLMWSALAIGIGSAWPVVAVQAQPVLGCPTQTLPRGPKSSFPASGADGVTLDAPLRVSYSAGFLDTETTADLLEVLACEGSACSEQSLVEGELSIVEDELFFVPTSSWNPFTEYRATAFGTDRNLQFGFTTGSSVDVSPPAFSGGISVNTEAAVDPCHDETAPGEPEQGYRVEISFAPATDDGALGDIQYQLFLTRGPEVADAELVAQARNFGATERVSLAFFLDAEASKQTHCVDMIVIDGVGNVTNSREHRCFNATFGRDFVGCAVATAPVSYHTELCLMLLAVALVRHRRRAPTSR